MNNRLLAVFALILAHYGVTANSDINTEDRVKDYGYPAENHTIVTPDGFELTVVRIQGKTHSHLQSPRPVVLMMHGLSSSSDCWIIGGPANASAFFLADSGYDVWLGNSRGNPYARKPYDRDYWGFSWHEIGMIDLPATIDYILGVTNQSSLHYVGHSQGTTILLVLLSTLPEYGSKVKTSHLLAPIAFMENAKSKLIDATKKIIARFSSIGSLIRDTDFLHYLKDFIPFKMCRIPIAKTLCAKVVYDIYGGPSAYLNNSLLPEIFETHPVSSSARQAIHLVQLKKSGKFRQYDFNILGNLQSYGSLSPPDYKLGNIRTSRPLNLYYSAFDELSSYLDVENLISILGDKVKPHFINLQQFAHIDFVFGFHARVVIFEDILKKMNEEEGIVLHAQLQYKRSLI